MFSRSGGVIAGGLAHVVHRPERSEVGRESSPDKLVIAVSVAPVLLSRIVHTGVGRVGRVKFLLAETQTNKIKLSGLDQSQLYSIDQRSENL